LLENEEKSKRKIIQELENDKYTLLKIQKEQKRAMDVITNEEDVKQKRDQIKAKIKKNKDDIKEKQLALRKQEKQTKDEHEALIDLELKNKKLQTLINEKKAGIVQEVKAKTEEDVKAIESEVQKLEKTHIEEKKKFNKTITSQETKLTELSHQLDALSLEIANKDQECRLTTLKISEIKRQVRIGASKATQEQIKESKVTKDVEQIKKDMKAEKTLEENGKSGEQQAKSLESCNAENNNANLFKTEIQQEGKKELPPVPGQDSPEAQQQAK